MSMLANLHKLPPDRQLAFWTKLADALISYSQEHKNQEEQKLQQAQLIQQQAARDRTKLDTLRTELDNLYS